MSIIFMIIYIFIIIIITFVIDGDHSNLSFNHPDEGNYEEGMLFVGFGKDFCFIIIIIIIIILLLFYSLLFK